MNLILMTSIVTGVYKFKSYSNKIIFLCSIFLIKGLYLDYLMNDWHFRKIAITKND